MDTESLDLSNLIQLPKIRISNIEQLKEDILKMDILYRRPKLEYLTDINDESLDLSNLIQLPEIRISDINDESLDLSNLI